MGVKNLELMIKDVSNGTKRALFFDADDTVTDIKKEILTHKLFMSPKAKELNKDARKQLELFMDGEPMADETVVGSLGITEKTRKTVEVKFI